MRLQYHRTSEFKATSPEMLMYKKKKKKKKRKKKGGDGCEQHSLGRRRSIKTSSLVNIFLGSRMRTLSHRLSFFSAAARALSAPRSRRVTPR